MAAERGVKKEFDRMSLKIKADNTEYSDVIKEDQ